MILITMTYKLKQLTILDSGRKECIEYLEISCNHIGSEGTRQLE